MPESATAVTQPDIKKDAQSPSRKPRKQPPYNVILLDDNVHTFEYVIEMLGKLFGHNETKAFKMATEVHVTGRVIVETTTLERAELKRDQILAYGPGPERMGCKGSMRATIEPTE